MYSGIVGHDDSAVPPTLQSCSFARTRFAGRPVDREQSISGWPADISLQSLNAVGCPESMYVTLIQSYCVPLSTLEHPRNKRAPSVRSVNWYTSPTSSEGACLPTVGVWPP